MTWSTGLYTLDKTPVQTIAICKGCGRREAANTSPAAQRLIVAHLTVSKVCAGKLPRPE